MERIYKEGKAYSSFYNLLENEKVFFSDYDELDLARIKALSDYGLVAINDEKQIVLSDMAKLTILNDLYCNEAISRYHYPQEATNAISEWLEKGILQESNSLLSKPEIDYFDYLLNDRFVNGPKVRNKIVHGIMQMNQDENVHKYYFYILLRVFTILAIKINDDFCLFDVQRRKQNA